MATRSLTEVYILMRNNALQSRHMFSEQVSSPTNAAECDALADDRMALVSTSHVDLELGIVGNRNARLPPEWVDGVEEIQFEVSRIKLKSKELAALHDKHMNRPTMDDSIDEEHAIEIQTQEITQMFSRCQKLIHQINLKSKQGTTLEKTLSQNIVSSLARTIQEMSTNFKKCQSTYLRKLKSREERSRQFFDHNLGGQDSAIMKEEVNLLDDGDYDTGFTDGQLQMVQENTLLVQNRENEIVQIVRSIQDLNEIFKDLASMIVDQGTILDRIDYNIDNATVQVEQGLQSLQKAQKYQKGNKKMYFIMFLALLIIILIIVLIATKS